MTKAHPEYQYLDLLQDILDNGADKQIFLNDVVSERYKKEGKEIPFIRSVFGRQIRFDLSKGFPLLTTKKTFWEEVDMIDWVSFTLGAGFVVLLLIVYELGKHDGRN